MEKEFMACEVCHRVIWVEDGPMCIYCGPKKPKRRAKKGGVTDNGTDKAEVKDGNKVE